jgi:hypothetical protein
MEKGGVNRGDAWKTLDTLLACTGRLLAFLIRILKIRRSRPPFSYVLIFNSHGALE